MKKRGQVTTFMIVGLVLLIIVLLLFAVKRTGIGVKTSDYLQSNLDDIKVQINKCVDQEAVQALNLIGKQGGYLNPSNYRLYKGYEVSYLCFNIPNADNCMNSIVSTKDIEEQLNNYLKANVPSCANINGLANSLFFPGMEVGELNIKTTIQKDSVLFDIDYPITLKKGDATAKLTPYKEAVSAPLGLLLDTTYDIINQEAANGVFFEVQYMLANRGNVEIYKDQPYPDKVYVLNERDSDYVFQFAIESEGANE
ncbi:MAG: hypothetical protein KJ623_03345 [Nanoarchaeota archaeon]|nr:hypothetical protein [Nanoarchaeota archaeon]